MRKRKWAIPGVILVLVGGFSAYHFLQKTEENMGATLLVSGNIEATTVDVAFKIPGKIEKLLVEEGDYIREGQLTAQLEDRDLQAQKARAQASLETAQSRIPAIQKNIQFQDRATSDDISQAEAGVAVAQERLKQLLEGARPQEVQSAKAEADQALADLEKHKADMDRSRKLYQDQYIAAQDWDAARTAHEMAVARYHKAQETYALVVEGPRREEIAVARAQLDQAKAALSLAKNRTLQVDVLRRDLATAQAQVKEAAASLEVIQSQIEYTRLYAPAGGVVLVKNAEPGEFIVPGGAAFTLGDLERPWLKAFIDERDLGRVKLGQRVSVNTDSYPGKVYAGKVTFIASEAEFTPKNVQTAKERIKLVYRIKVSLGNPHGELKPGMPADGRIHLTNS